MYTPQAGIFALGTSSHAYLEFDILDAKKCKQFASTISAIREPRTTAEERISSSALPELGRDISIGFGALLNSGLIDIGPRMPGAPSGT